MADGATTRGGLAVSAFAWAEMSLGPVLALTAAECWPFAEEIVAPTGTPEAGFEGAATFVADAFAGEALAAGDALVGRDSGADVPAALRFVAFFSLVGVSFTAATSFALRELFTVVFDAAFFDALAAVTADVVEARAFTVALFRVALAAPSVFRADDFDLAWRSAPFKAAPADRFRAAPVAVGLAPSATFLVAADRDDAGAADFEVVAFDLAAEVFRVVVALAAAVLKAEADLGDLDLVDVDLVDVDLVDPDLAVATLAPLVAAADVRVVFVAAGFLLGGIAHSLAGPLWRRATRRTCEADVRRYTHRTDCVWSKLRSSAAGCRIRPIVRRGGHGHRRGARAFAISKHGWISELVNSLLSQKSPKINENRRLAHGCARR